MSHQILAALQTSIYDQAYFYGCRHVGSWGFRDERGRLNKNYYALKAFGPLMADGRLRLVKPDTHSAAFLVRFGK